MDQYRVTSREIDNEELTIDLAELFMALWSKIHIIVLSGILVALLAFVGTKLLITPTYTSVTKVYVLTRQDSNASVTYSDLQTSTQFMKDYMELVKSRPVLEQVIAVLNLDKDVNELANMISVSATQTDTRILSISVESEDPKEAKEIADAVREAAGIQITEIMDADAVNTVEDGNLPTEPSAPNTLKNTAFGGILGIVIAIGIIVLIFIFDDTIKTPDDVEKYLGLTVLTSIPIREESGKAKKAKKPKRVSGKTAMKSIQKK